MSQSTGSRLSTAVCLTTVVSPSSMIGSAHISLVLYCKKDLSGSDWSGVGGHGLMQVCFVITHFNFISFYRATACNATHGIAVAILSVCPSVKCVYCDKTKQRTANILIPHETAITLVFWHQQWLVDDAPFPLKSALKVAHPFEKHRLRPISAHNVSTVGDSEKSSITTNIKSTTGFPTSHRWSAYVTFKYPKGWLKERFFTFLSISQRMTVSSAVNLVRRSVS